MINDVARTEKSEDNPPLSGRTLHVTDLKQLTDPQSAQTLGSDEFVDFLNGINERYACRQL